MPRKPWIKRGWNTQTNMRTSASMRSKDAKHFINVLGMTSSEAWKRAWRNWPNR